MVGDLIAERYELEELVGTGGMSSVYRAHDTLLERTVALKVLHQQFTADGDYVERFRREARSVAQLSHPNIVTVIDRGKQDDRQFIVFEYVDGENLKALVEREGPLSEHEAVQLALQIARALGFAHQHGLVHRDVKPQNVLLGGSGQAKVTDFGIARSLDMQVGLTQTGTVMGTSDYIAPEQARGQRVDPQTDIYSLGAVLFELLTGEVPFPGDNFVAVAMRHINEPAPSVRERRPELSPRVDAIVRRAMAKHPRERFASMDELCAELSACLEPESAVSGAQTMITAPQRRPWGARRRRVRGPRADGANVWPLILLLAGLAVLAGILAAIFTFTGASERIPDIVGGNKKSGSTEKPVQLRGLAAYDPDGDETEHDSAAPNATDGNRGTYWNTEHYDGGLRKNGVGLVVDAGASMRLSQIVLQSDTPGFTATIRGGASSTGPFTARSKAQTVGSRTSFPLRGGAARYYVVWITDLGSNDSAKLNTVTARGG
ncbi:MAG TPA: protein kinase [Gaiellaceae bacterium]|nr:protein kinase [Gaiellaceae bacterium]